MKIKFGTDGWRAIIAQEYTVDNVARVSVAAAHWLNNNFDNPSVVIGHDCRFLVRYLLKQPPRYLTTLVLK